ncbi:response regulator [Sinomonas atrocyanea]
METHTPFTEAIRVLILSGHRLVRCTLPELLRQEGFEVVATEDTVAAAVRAAAATCPDVALLSNRVPDGTGIEACRALREAAPATRCIIMTTYDDQKALRATALADAAGCVPQSPRTGPLAEALRRVAAGERLHSPEAAMATARSREAHSPLEGAPGPEQAIWALMLQGRTNSQISAELDLPHEAFTAGLAALLARLGYRPSPHPRDSTPEEEPPDPPRPTGRHPVRANRLPGCASQKRLVAGPDARQPHRLSARYEAVLCSRRSLGDVPGAALRHPSCIRVARTIERTTILAPAFAHGPGVRHSGRGNRACRHSRQPGISRCRGPARARPGQPPGTRPSAAHSGGATVPAGWTSTNWSAYAPPRRPRQHPSPTSGLVDPPHGDETEEQKHRLLRGLDRPRRAAHGWSDIVTPPPTDQRRRRAMPDPGGWVAATCMGGGPCGGGPRPAHPSGPAASGAVAPLQEHSTIAPRVDRVMKLSSGQTVLGCHRAPWGEAGRLAHEWGPPVKSSGSPGEGGQMDPCELHHVHSNWIEVETPAPSLGAEPERVYKCTKPSCGWTYRHPSIREGEQGG